MKKKLKPFWKKVPSAKSEKKTIFETKFEKSPNYHPNDNRSQHPSNNELVPKFFLAPEIGGRVWKKMSEIVGCRKKVKKEEKFSFNFFTF